jgi:opacity protein-like surface antigen
MRTTIYKLFALAAIITIVLAPWKVCNAESNRTGRTEVGASFMFLGGESTEESGVSVSEDDWSMYGFNVGYNYNEYLNINTEFVFGSIDVDASGLPAGYDVSGDQDTFIWLVNLDYNILNKPLTPYVTGGIGYGHSSGDVTYTTPYGIGKISADDSGFAYSLGVGGRWDITDNIFAKVAYRIVWDDSGDDRDGIGVSVGYMF